MQLAPIILFTYNRLWHTQRTVEALAANALAEESELIVFCDGARKEEDKEKVTEVRVYANSITGFRKVTVVERQMNLGLANSIIQGVTDVVNQHGRVIVLEDDIVTSPYFLQYMNEGLELYKDDLNVAALHGYIYPVDTTLPETFFLRDPGCWGWATWKRSWAFFEPDGKKLLDEIERRNLSHVIDYNHTYPFTTMLRDQIEGKNNSWAIRWYISNFIKDRLTLYPGRSLVKNIGNDNSGVHSGTTDIYDVELTRSPIRLNRIPITESAKAYKAYTRFFEKIGYMPNKSLIQKVIAIIYNRLHS